MRNHYLAGAVVVGILTGSGALRGQDPMRPTPPQIITASQGEVRVAPDRASVSIGVQSRATTAAEAAAQNSRKQRAVIDAIKARGIPAEQISTSNFSVIPETRYDREGQAAPKTTSYLVVNTITAEVRKIDLVGPIIDAALAAGANQINSLSFGVTAVDSLRRAALALAVTRSRADAEAMARAAGGMIGNLIEITSMESYSPPMPMAYRSMQAEAKDSSVPVEPGQEVIRANITARWQFVAAGAGK